MIVRVRKGNSSRYHCKTPVRRRPYTEDEIQCLREMAESYYSQAEIAEALGRTIGSVSSVIAARGLATHGPRGGTPGYRERKRHEYQSRDGAKADRPPRSL